MEERAAASQRALAKKTEEDEEAQRAKREAERAWQVEKLELEHNVERRRLQREAAPTP